jgi:hypothetical protein
MPDKRKLHIRYDEFMRHTYQGYPSFCTNCAEYDPHASCVEPDAENYYCESCDTNNLMGVEQAVIHGLVIITDHIFEA